MLKGMDEFNQDMDANTVMSMDITWVPPEMKLAEAYALMQSLRVRHLPVVSGGVLCGILSNRDTLFHATQKGDGTPVFPDKPVSDVMSASPVSCGPSASIPEIAGLMADRRIDCIPVVDTEGGLMGLITSRDLLEVLRGLKLGPARLSFRLRQCDQAFDR